MKFAWSTNGETSTTRIIEAKGKKYCPHCKTNEGHFNDCPIWKKEVEEGKWD